MPNIAGLIVILLLLFAGPAAQAQENDGSNDLFFLPEGILQDNVDAAGDEHMSLPDAILSDQEPSQKKNDFLLPLKVDTETSLRLFLERDSIPVPTPDSDFLRSQFIQAVNFRLKTKLFPRLELILSDKAYYAFEYGRQIDDHCLLNDLKEFYFSGAVGQNAYIDLGRINFKNGVAMGYNPTDYFKKDAVSRQLFEQDPNRLREERIGTVMIRGQYLSSALSFSAAYAPKINSSGSSFWQDDNVFGLGLADLNESNRFIAKFGLNMFKDVKTEVLFYTENGDVHAGTNISRNIGDRIVAYLEWSGGNRLDVISEAAERFGEEYGGDTKNFVLEADMAKHFFNQLAVGFSYSGKEVDRTTYFEYHFNQAGLSGDDWDQWFDQGESATNMLGNPSSAELGAMCLGQLWTIRENEIQDLLSRHELFIRTQWNDFLMDNLDLSGIAKIDLSSGGVFFQPELEYQVSEATWITLSAGFNAGSSHSSYGSLPYSTSGKIVFHCYF
jgi:hypothetical protein